MGASVSKTSVDIVNNSIIDAITNNVNNCSSSATQNQQVNLGGFGLFTDVSQSATLNVSCLQKIQMTNDLSTQIAQKIQQDAKAAAVALIPSFSGAENTTKLANYIQTNISTSTIQNCASGALQNQIVSTSGIQIGASVSQTLKLFSQCLQTALNNNSVSQKIVQNTNQTASSTVTNPLSFLSGILSLPIIIGILIFIGFVIFAVVIYNLMPGGSSMPDLSQLQSQIQTQLQSQV